MGYPRISVPVTLFLLTLFSGAHYVTAEDSDIDTAADEFIETVGLANVIDALQLDELEFECGVTTSISVSIPDYRSRSRDAGSREGTPAECEQWRQNPASANQACSPPPNPVSYTDREVKEEKLNAAFYCVQAILSKIGTNIVTCVKPSDPPQCKKDSCVPVPARFSVQCPKERDTSEELTGRVRHYQDGTCELRCQSSRFAPGFNTNVSVGCSECVR